MIHNNIDREAGNNDFFDSVQFYYQDLKRYNPIPKQEEKELMKKAKKGDIGARNKILTSNLRFVFDIAKKYRGNGVDLSELIAEGNNGLIRAIEKFDINQDVKFYSYAVWWIRQRMMAAIERNNSKKNVESSFDETFGPKDDKDNKIENIFSDDDNDYDDSNDISDEPDNFLENNEEETQKHFVVHELLARLDKRERVIIEKYYGIENDDDGENLESISKTLNLTTERVRQLKVKAINDMRNEVFSIKEAEFLF